MQFTALGYEIVLTGNPLIVALAIFLAGYAIGFWDAHRAIHGMIERMLK